MTTNGVSIQAIIFTKSTTFFTNVPLFSQMYHFFHKSYLEYARTRSNFLERYRTVCVPYVSMVPKNYDYRRLKAQITRTAKKKGGTTFFKKKCFCPHPTYLAWEVPLFSKNEPNFSIENEFTWETKPACSDVPECYLRPLPRAESLAEPFPGADACRSTTPGQGGQYHFFQYMNAVMPYLRGGAAIGSL